MNLIKMNSLWAVLILLLGSASAEAGFFNTANFVAPGKNAIGLEPELTLSDGAGLAVNAKYTQGVSDLINVAGIIGGGGGPRRFRIGGDVVFDFFPDIDTQPGIGLLTRAIYYTLPNTGQFNVIAAPYIHKAFKVNNGGQPGEIDPFLSIPVGMAFSDGNYHTTTQLVIGSMIKGSESIKYSAELGIDLNYAETYISGGITFYP